MAALDANLLTCFYFFLLMLGVFYAILTMVAGGLHAIHLPSLDIDLGGLHLPGAPHVDIGAAAGHDVSLLSLSPISIAAFVTAFGGIGLIATEAFHVDAGGSLIWATVGAFIISLISHFIFFYVFIAPQASTALKASDILGATAEVITPIPAASVGEIAYVALGERHTASARSADGVDIPRGTLVTITKLAGTVMIVKQADK